MSQPYLDSKNCLAKCALLDLAAKPGIPRALLLKSWKGQEHSSWSGKSQFTKVLYLSQNCSSLKEKKKRKQIYFRLICYGL